MFRRSFALVAVLALVAAACGDDEPVATTVAPGTTAATTTTAAPAYAGDTAAAPDCSYGGNMKSIEAVDEFTVKFTLCATDVAFPAKAAFSSFAIHPKEEFAATGGKGALIEKPIGTGPYKIKQWTRGTEIVLEANPDYWGEAPKAKTLIFRWSAESAQRLIELTGGTVDGIDNVGRDDIATIEADSALQLKPRPPLNVFYLGMNRDKEPFDDERVRQAIAMGIDRERIVKNFYPAGSSVAVQFLPADIFGFTPEPAWYEYDQDAAKKLLADAGASGAELVLNYRNVVRGYLNDPPKVAQDIQDQLSQIGLNVKLEEMESGAFLDASDAGELQFYLLGWGADYPDATNFLDYHFGSGSSAQFGAHHKDIEDILAEGASEPDPNARLGIYEEATGLIRQHVPMVPVAHGASAVAFTSTVAGAHASPLGNEYFAVMDPGKDTLVWMQNGEPAGLYCADESDGEALRVCEQFGESLLRYEVGGTAVEPSLATDYTTNADGTEWTFNLREGVKFHDGSSLDANDVVASFAVQWDVANPYHVGRDGSFTYYGGFFGKFLNAPAS